MLARTHIATFPTAEFPIEETCFASIIANIYLIENFLLN
jgi:hypothetical protein